MLYEIEINIGKEGNWGKKSKLHSFDIYLDVDS
jgi:hypothetical protein